jgi:phenylalanyl-tRNA synthetase beta chain
MRLSFNWLKEFVEFSEQPDKVAEILTFLGFETQVISKGPEFTGVVTAKVIEKDKHPNADKLSLCKVSDGTNTYSVVCGAPNVEAGQTVAFAKLGAELPGGFKIEGRKIRGVESQGMICSQKELGLKEDTPGIIVLESSTPLGKNFRELISDNDAILDLETTTNRPDCLSHLGVSRELSAYYNKPVNLPKQSSALKDSGDINIEVAEPELCPRYIGVKISGVKIAQSPGWLSERLIKCGLRPINNIVDITNYVLMEYGHPLHAFDLNLLEENKIVVRCAKAETIKALDCKEYALSDDMLVIADGRKPQAIAGIMGGEHSGVTESTKDIILESAVFKPSCIRKTSKKLNLSSDSSYRFERGTSWDVCEMASNRAVSLILELCGGKVDARKDVVFIPFQNKVISFRPDRVGKLLGLEVPKEKTVSILGSLGMQIAEKDNILSVTVPSWRLDCSLEADMVEEVARMNGYDKIPVTIPHLIPDLTTGKSLKPKEHILGDRLVSLGFSQALNYSFIDKKSLDRFGMAAFEHLKNPLSKENESMRPSLLPGLMANIELNVSHITKAVKLFEIGNVFLDQKQVKMLGIICHGPVWGEWWKLESENLKSPDIDFSYFRGIIETILSGQHIKIDSTDKKLCKSYFHPGRWAAIIVKGKPAGQFGVLHPGLISGYEKEVVYAELEIDSIHWSYDSAKFKPLKRFPVVKRDLALVADKAITYGEIAGEIEKLKKSSKELSAIFENMSLFSKYELKDAGKVSYALHFTFQHNDHTLSESEIQTAVTSILKTLESSLSITLRT